MITSNIETKIRNHSHSWTELCVEIFSSKSLLFPLLRLFIIYGYRVNQSQSRVTCGVCISLLFCCCLSFSFIGHIFTIQSQLSMLVLPVVYPCLSGCEFFFYFICFAFTNEQKKQKLLRQQKFFTSKNKTKLSKTVTEYGINDNGPLKD